MAQDDDAKRELGRRRRVPTPNNSGLPMPVLALVVVVLLGYLGYAMVVLKADGLPFAWIIGGLLGGTLGIDQYLKNRGAPPPGGGGE